MSLPPTFHPTDTTTPKRCFVTVGATASFHSLIRAVVALDFLQALKSHGYSELRVQYGKDGKKTFDDFLWTLAPDNEPKSKYDVEVTGFDFDRDGLWKEMVLAKDGCVVSHAGSGSILDALRVAAPLLVVPNPELMDNHQVELAEVLEEQKYVIHGKLENLAEGITKIEELRTAMQQWPPVTAGDKRGGLVRVVKEEMGWLD